MADIDAFFARSLDIADARRHRARPHRARSRHRLRQDARSRASTAIASLRELKTFGLPLLVGASRKRFIDTVSPAPPDQRLGGSIAAHLAGGRNGAAIMRTHDVAETMQALRVAAAIRSAR